MTFHNILTMVDHKTFPQSFLTTTLRHSVTVIALIAALFLGTGAARAQCTVFDVGGGGAFCTGGTGTTVTLSGSETGVSYQLKNGATNVQGAKAGTGLALTWTNVTSVGTLSIVANKSTAPTCSATMNGSAVVSANPLPVLFTISGTGAICSGAAGLTITLDGSAVDVNYQLKRGAALVGSAVPGTGSPLTWTNIATAGTYTVIATDAITNCSRTMTGNAVITVNPLPGNYTLSGAGVVCSGGPGRTLTLNGSQATASYQLRLNGVDTGSPTPGTGVALTWTNITDAGTYTVVSTLTATGCIRVMSGSPVITVTAYPVTYDIGGGGTICSGATTTVTLSSSETGVSYQLKNGATNVQGAKNGNGSALTWTGVNTAGTYTIVGTRSGCAVTMNNTATVTVNPLPTAFTVSGTGPICSGAPGLTITLDGSQTGVNYQLRRGAVLVGSPQAGTGAALTWTNNATAGTYTVLATDATTSCVKTMTGNAIITVNALPTAYSVSGTGGVCVGDAGRNITLSNSQATVSYQLRLNGVDLGAPVTGTGAALTWANQTAAGAYTVFATNTTTGCARQMTNTATITVNPMPALFNVTGGNICASGSITVGLDVSATGVRYQLKLDGTNLGAFKNGTGSALTWGSQTAPGTYTIVATIPATGCNRPMTGSSGINPLPTAFNVTGGGVSCPGGNGVTISLSDTQTGVNYQLNFEGNPVGSPRAGTGDTLNWVNQSAAGVYTVTSVNATTGCTRAMTGSATVIDQVPVVFNVTGGGTCFISPGPAIGLSSSEVSVNYQLYVDGLVTGAPKAGTGSALSWTDQQREGTYTVTATHGVTGCVSEMNGFRIVRAVAAWTNKGGVTESSGALAKTVGNGWGNAGAISMNRLDSGRNGSLSFAATSGRFLLGFASSTANFSYSSIDYGFEVDNGQLTIVESGTKIPMGAYVNGDSLTIGRVGSSIVYYKNGAELHTSPGDSLRSYRIKSSIYSTGSPAVITSFAKVPTGETNPLLAELPASYIPDDVKPIRKNIPVIAPLERQFLLRDLTQGDTLDVFEAPPCLEGNYYLGFQLYYDLGDKNTQEDWSAFIELQLLHGEDTLWTKPLLNEMTTQTFIGTVFHNTLVSCDGDYRLVINRKNVEGTAPEENIYMKILLFKQMEDVFSPSADLQLNCSYSDNETLLGWNYAGKAVIEYDIEWVFIDNHDAFSGSTAQDAFGFKEPVRITTASPYYTHQLYYPDGRVWYRARAVGYNPQYPDHRIPGQWFYSPCSAISISNHQANMTWQEQTVFAEEGKYKKIMSYFDGTQRQRQVQTNLSTEQVTLVGESMYDFEGRKSIDVLAVPAADASLAYRPGFNQFVAGDGTVASHTSASRKKFHYDNYRLPNSVASGTTGAGKYYSPNNDQGGIHRDYIPDAAGFVYTQTEYMNDGTGRARRQSGLGQQFNMDGIHTTRYFYGSAAPSELIRLFGTNVGNATHYKKNLVVDPNGQVSVSYLDQEGRTIATALAGDPPSNVDSLQSYKDLDPALLTVDISTKNKKDDYISKISHKILNAVPNTNYTFHYDLSAYASQVEAFGCQACSFDLLITITDPDGTPLDLSSAAGNESANGLSYARNNITAESCSSPTFVNDVDFAIPFAEIGDYTVTKTVTPHELTFEQIQQLVEADEDVQEQVSQIRQGYTQDAADCDVCTSGPDAEAAINQAITEVAEQDCENIYQQIIQYYTERYSASVDTVYTVPQDSIQVHPLYCKYQLCAQNKSSDAFEKQYNRIANWDAAVSTGYTNLVDIDPFFNDAGLSGYSYKSAMQSKLADEYVATVGYDSNGDSQVDGENVYSGPIDQVTDPSNTSFYVDSRGNPDPVNGKHLLYIDLMGRRSALGETSYQSQLSEQRWEQYKSFYTESKRKTKLEITEYASCPSAVEELHVPDNLPSTEEDIAALAETNPGPVTNAELETTLQGLKAACNTTFSPADSTAIAGHLQTYMNARPSNFFRLILKPDLGVDPELVAIQSILNGYSCGLDSIALDDPIMCARDTTVTISAYTQGANQTMMMMAMEGPNGGRMMVAEEKDPIDSLRRSNEEKFKGELLEKSKQEREKLKDRYVQEYRSGKWSNSAAPVMAVNTAGISKDVAGEGERPGDKEIATANKKRVDDVIDSLLSVRAAEMRARSLNVATERRSKSTSMTKGQSIEKNEVKKATTDTTQGPPIDNAIKETHARKARELADTKAKEATKRFEARRDEKQKEHFAKVEKIIERKAKRGATPAVQQSAQKSSFGTLSASLPSQEEYDALIEFYNSTNGPGWTNKTGWSTADPNTIEDVSTWYGVTVNFAGHVTMLSLSGNNINGPIPASFNDLQWIQYIWLSSNGINGLPENFGDGWTDLQIFYAEYNQIGHLPDSFGNGWINVFDIHLQSNQLTSLPESFGTGWARLRDIYLDNNELTDLPPAFENNEWPIFYQAYLRNNHFTSLSEDFGSGWPHMSTIMLDNNQLTSLPANFGEAWSSSMFSVSLEYNQLTSLPAGFGQNWTNIYAVSLANNNLTSLPSDFGDTWSGVAGITLRNNQLTTLPPAFSTGMPTLSYLDAAFNPFGTLPSGFGSLMTNMNYLTLDHAGLTSLPPVFETGFPNLSYLTMSENSFGTFPSTFGDGFNSINYLVLTNSGLTSLPSGFGDNWSTLSSISFGYNSLGTLPSDFGDGWTNLQSIDLSSAQLTELPATFGSTWNLLGYLTLSVNALSELPASLGSNWTQLTQFDIGGNHVSDLPSAALTTWPTSAALSVSSNRFTFEDLLPAIARYPGNVYYGYQDFVDVAQSVQATLGAPLTLTANVDRTTSPASVYQWFKNGVAVTSADASSHTLNIASVSYSDLGTYYYKITNPNASDLTLSSFNQNITVECTATPEDEYDALMSFYNSSNGPAWVNNTNWGQPFPAALNTWYGLGVDEDGRVIQLSLPNNNIQGPFPVDITKFCKLTVIELSNNHITGSIPDGIGTLTDLYWISLRQNQVTGPLPPSMGNLSNMLLLSLENNQFNGSIPAELGNMSQLSTFSAGNNSLSGSIPPELGNLHQLYSLNLGVNQLTGGIPSALGGLYNLHGLNLSVNPLGGSIPEELGYLYNLEGIGLDANQLTGPIPSTFGNLTNLGSIDLGNNQLTGNIPAGLSNSTPMQFMNLSSNALDGPIPAQFSNLVNLSQMFLGGNQLTGTVPPELGQLTNLTFLSLTSNELTGSIPVELGNLTNLNSLDIGMNHLTGGIPSQLGNLPNLQFLDFRTNELSGTLPVELSQLTNLYFLGLSDNHFSGTLPAGIENLTHLQYLEIARNDLSGNIPPQLTSSLYSVRIEGNKFTFSDFLPLKQSFTGQYFFYDIQGFVDVPKSIPADDGQQIILTADVDRTTSPASKYQWFFNGSPVTGIDQSNYSYTINSFSAADAGDYFYTIINDDASELTLTSNLQTISVNTACNSTLEEEYSALMAIYNSTGGTEWQINTNWGTPFPTNVGNWYGVHTDAEGHVTSLNLYFNGLNGTIPSDVSKFCRLDSLDLGTNNLSGSIPSSITMLQELRYLNLDGDAFTGPIPALLGSLLNLQFLDLSQNQFDGSIPVELGNLINLRFLDMGSNSLSGAIPPELGQLDKLKTLLIPFNHISGSIPVELGSIDSLEWLDLNSNQLSGSIPSELGNLSALKILELTWNQLTGSIPVEVGNLSQLQNMALSVNALTGSIPTSLGSLSSLQYLSLGSNQLTGSIPTEFGNLSQLLSLDLSFNQLSGTLPIEFGQLTDLEGLGISYNSISGNIPTELGNCTSLQSFSAYGNQLSGPIPAELGNCTQLILLDLSVNQLSGPIPPQLGSLTQIRDLFLPGNQLSGNIPVELSNLAQVQRLYLAFNQLTGTIPAEFGGLTTLQELGLYNNQLTGSIPAELGNMTNARWILLGSNELSGTIPLELNDGSFIDRIYIDNNMYTMTDLLPTMSDFSNVATYIYYAQDSVDIRQTYTIPAGGSQAFDTNIDIATDPASKYQWFKVTAIGADTPMQPSPTTGGHAFNIPGAGLSDAGKYYYTIINDNVPYLTLYSKVQFLIVQPPLDSTRTLTICLENNTDPATNPTLAAFTFTVDWNEEVQKCMNNLVKQDSILTEYAISKFVEERATSYYNSYRTNCLSGLTEHMDYKYVNKEYHYTLYYFDQSGNLVQTVAPTGVHPLTPVQVAAFLAGTHVEPGHEMLTKYGFSSINKTIAVVTPDAGRTEFLYDRKGQLRISQNARQYNDHAYSYAKYDVVGRTVQVGEFNNILPLSDFVDDVESFDFPSENLHDVTIMNFDRPDSLIQSIFAQENLRDLLSWSLTMQAGTQDTVKTYYSYDIHGNAKAVLQQIPGIGHKRFDYVCDPVSGKQEFRIYQQGRPDQFIHKYTYDADNRITGVETSTDGFIWNKDATYSYYKHGHMARTEIGEYRVQGLDHYYAIQGWIKGVNMPFDQDPGQDGQSGNLTGRDAFAYSLGYYSQDYAAIGGVQVTDDRDALWIRFQEQFGNVGSYSGSVGWMVTDLKKINETSPEKGLQAMMYRYDQINQLTKSRSLTEYVPGDGFSARSGDGGYDENFSYDASGNLLTLLRNDDQALVKDDLNYVYYENSNRLRSVTGALDTTYVYDEVGNLIKDKSKNVHIDWTPVGKVKTVWKSDSSYVSYRYDASGNRVAKIEVQDSITHRSIYVRDAEGRLVAIYKDSTLAEQPIFGASRLGNYLGGVKDGYRTLGHKKYELSNHLGNVLVVVTDNIEMASDSVWARVSSVADYYAFGLTMDARSYNDTLYRYGFNGKEIDKSFGTTSYDYGFRIYDPTLGRFLSVDPLTTDYPWYSPYQFSGNNPITYYDLDGLEEQTAIDGSKHFGPVNIHSINIAIVKGALKELKSSMNQKPLPAPTYSPGQKFLGPNMSNLSYKETQARMRAMEYEKSMDRLKGSVPPESRMIGEGVMIGLATAPVIMGGEELLVLGARQFTKVALVKGARTFSVNFLANAGTQWAFKGDLGEVDFYDAFSSGATSLIRKKGISIAIDVVGSAAVDMSLNKGTQVAFVNKSGGDFLWDLAANGVATGLGEGTMLAGKRLNVKLDFGTPEQFRAAVKAFSPEVKEILAESLESVLKALEGGYVNEGEDKMKQKK